MRGLIATHQLCAKFLPTVTNNNFVVIVENDESEWEDQTGIMYHYPKRYAKYLQPGTRAIYYKGKLRRREFEKSRLSNEPHYFGIATIGNSFQDRNSDKEDLFATIDNYEPFAEAVLAKEDSEYLETIPASRASNYWRDGVRAISQDVYAKIKGRAKLGTPINNKEKTETLNDREVLLESIQEGSPKACFSTTYERSKALREQAIAIHGTSCAACGFNFKSVYGEYGEGYIQIHHIFPVSEFDKPRAVNPELELIPLCANCHAIVHRRKGRTLSIEELTKLIHAQHPPSQ